MKVVIQGYVGSFHDEAARKFFDTDIDLVPMSTFTGVFHALSQNRADFGLVAVENSLFGSIHETYDQLLKNNVVIIGEVILPVHQQLIAHPGVSLDQIDSVMSHPAALDQCRDFLAKNLPNAKLIEHQDTAGAVLEIKKQNLTKTAGIASLRAAHIYDMPVLAKNIEDTPDNFTRFVVLSPTPEQIKQANKASLVLITPHRTGALLNALKVFAAVNSNLTKLESRPIRGEPFRYQFIVDATADQDQLISLTHQLEQQGCQVTLLGHYRADSA